MKTCKVHLGWAGVLAGALASAAAAAVMGACGGNATASGGGPLPAGPSCPGGEFPAGEACNACLAARCASDEACLSTDCADFYGCSCACAAGDGQCIGRCAAMPMSSQCATCGAAFTQCSEQNCQAECDSPDAGAVVIHLDASFDPDAPATACADFAACCASIGNAELKAQCASSLPSDPVGCESALQFYETAGFCE